MDTQPSAKSLYRDAVSALFLAPVSAKATKVIQLVVLVEHGVEEPADVVARPWPDLGAVGAAGVRPLGRVVSPPSPHHCLAQGEPDRPMCPGASTRSSEDHSV